MSHEEGPLSLLFGDQIHVDMGCFGATPDQAVESGWRYQKKDFERCIATPQIAAVFIADC